MATDEEGSPLLAVGGGMRGVVRVKRVCEWVACPCDGASVARGTKTRGGLCDEDLFWRGGDSPDWPGSVLKVSESRFFPTGDRHPIR